MLNLDTHVLLYALTDDLSARERVLLSNETWSISAIVLWEIAKLSELGRIELDFPETSSRARTFASQRIYEGKKLVLPASAAAPSWPSFWP